MFGICHFGRALQNPQPFRAAHHFPSSLSELSTLGLPPSLERPCLDMSSGYTLWRPERAGREWCFFAVERGGLLPLEAQWGIKTPLRARCYGHRYLAPAARNRPGRTFSGPRIPIPSSPSKIDWCRIHKTTRVTPAMAANLTTRLWAWDDVLAVIDAMNAPKVRGPYKKKSNQGGVPNLSWCANEKKRKRFPASVLRLLCSPTGLHTAWCVLGALRSGER